MTLSSPKPYSRSVKQAGEFHPMFSGHNTAILLDLRVQFTEVFRPMSNTPPLATADPPSTVKVLLDALRGGDPSAANRLYEIVFRELRSIAARELRRERHNASLSPTELVNEAYLRLFAPGPPNAEDRNHFLAISCRVMRRFLVDRARRRNARKRASPEPQHLLELLDLESADPRIVILVDDALVRLAAFAPRAAHIIELRYFTGLEVREVAEHLNLSERTVLREWSMARAWLYGELNVQGKH
jgi:RNA polymerase sigma-70 factor, ECF subfamily